MRSSRSSATSRKATRSCGSSPPVRGVGRTSTAITRCPPARQSVAMRGASSSRNVENTYTSAPAGTTGARSRAKRLPAGRLSVTARTTRSRCRAPPPGCTTRACDARSWTPTRSPAAAYEVARDAAASRARSSEVTPSPSAVCPVQSSTFSPTSSRESRTRTTVASASAEVRRTNSSSASRARRAVARQSMRRSRSPGANGCTSRKSPPSPGRADWWFPVMPWRRCGSGRDARGTVRGVTTCSTSSSRAGAVNHAASWPSRRCWSRSRSCGPECRIGASPVRSAARPGVTTRSRGVVPRTLTRTWTASVPPVPSTPIR